MCVEQGNRDADTNSVEISGQMGGPLAFYHAKEQPRFEFMLRSVTPWGTVHKVRIQARGQEAHDLFMLYQFGRRITVRGYLKCRRHGYLCVVVREFGWSNKDARPFTLDDLMGKMKAMQEAEDRRQSQGPTEEPEPEDDLPTAADSILDEEDDEEIGETDEEPETVEAEQLSFDDPTPDTVDPQKPEGETEPQS